LKRAEPAARAAVSRAGEFEVLAHHPEERRLRPGIETVLGAVEVDKRKAYRSHVMLWRGMAEGDDDAEGRPGQIAQVTQAA
jgi:hypothetical protein